MSKQKKSSGGLLSRGYIFGLGAFRRYKELTGADVAHFEEALKPAFFTDGEGNVVYQDGAPVRVRDENVDEVEASYRWAVMLKCANDIYVNINGGDKLTVDEFTVMLDSSDQAESDELMNRYLDSNYMGRQMRDYYGIPKSTGPEKKSSAPAKRTARRSSTATK